MVETGPSPKRILLARHPQGKLSSSDFRIEEQTVAAPAEGEFLVRNLFISVDPMLRLMVGPAPFGGTIPAMPIGSTIPGAAVGEIVETRHPAFKVGDQVEGRFGWQHYAISNGSGVNRVLPHIGPVENALGIGGLPGFTAFVGLELAPEEARGTVLVSGAAGAVGSVVGPLVRARGGRAVGIVSSPAKCRYLIEEAGYAAAVDRTAADFHAQLHAAMPTGANLYFDNVGGPMFADIMPFMARGSQILICGLMAQYQDDGSSLGKDRLPAVLEAAMGKSIRIQAFTQFGREAMRPAFETEITRLLDAGSIRPALHVMTGIECLPDALIGLFERSVAGKVVVNVGK